MKRGKTERDQSERAKKKEKGTVEREIWVSVVRAREAEVMMKGVTASYTRQGSPKAEYQLKGTDLASGHPTTIPCFFSWASFPFAFLLPSACCRHYALHSPRSCPRLPYSPPPICLIHTYTHAHIETEADTQSSLSIRITTTESQQWPRQSWPQLQSQHRYIRPSL